MDKETLSNYGWIVIAVLVLAVMVALATPFGEYVENAVWSTTEGLFDVQESAFDVLGIDLNNDTADDIGTVGSDKTITLRGSKVADGTYTLKYENNGTPLTGYADICSLTITDGADASYTSLIAENCAPVGATVIGVYDSTDARVGEISLGSLKTNLGTKLYSFGAVADLHINSTGTEDKFANSLSYLTEIENVDFVTAMGDITNSGSADELSKYKSIIDSYAKKPVFAIAGNHDATTTLTYDSSDWTEYTGQNLWYTFTKGNDVYIMLGMREYSATQPFSNEELQWLYETLEENRNKRCFLFQHVFAWDGSGDAGNLYGGGNLLNNTHGEIFLGLVSHYKNVIWFHSHSHQDFDTQIEYQMNNIDNIYGNYSVHIPSLGRLKNVTNGSTPILPDQSEGYVVDVYENGILLKGREFVSEKYLPIASFYLDTEIKTIEAEQYFDSTGTIKNKNTPSAILPDRTEYILNERYSKSNNGFVEGIGYVSFIIPCTDKDGTSYNLTLKNTDYNSSIESSTLYTLDSSKSYVGVVNGTGNISKMTSGVTTLSDGSTQIEFTPTSNVSYVVLSINVEGNRDTYGQSVYETDILNYEITLK